MLQTIFLWLYIKRGNLCIEHACRISLLHPLGHIHSTSAHVSNCTFCMTLSCKWSHTSSNVRTVITFKDCEFDYQFYKVPVALPVNYFNSICIDSFCGIWNALHGKQDNYIHINGCHWNTNCLVWLYKYVTSWDLTT